MLLFVSSRWRWRGVAMTISWESRLRETNLPKESRAVKLGQFMKYDEQQLVLRDMKHNNRNMLTVPLLRSVEHVLLSSFGLKCFWGRFLKTYFFIYFKDNKLWITDIFFIQRDEKTDQRAQSLQQVIPPSCLWHFKLMNFIFLIYLTSWTSCCILV